MEHTIKLLKVFSDKNRIRIIHLLSVRKMCVCELAFILGVSQPSISRHLKKMKEVGIVGDEQDGFWTNYFLVECSVEAKGFMDCLNNLLKDKPELKEDVARVKQIKRTQLCCK